MQYTGGGQFADGTTEGSIGPEASLAAARYDQLRPHAANRESLTYGIIKMAAPEAMLGPALNPQATFSPPVEDAEDAANYERELIPPTVSEHSLFTVLLADYIRPAIRDLTDRGKLVLIDAIYTDLGNADCKTTLGHENYPRMLPHHLDNLWWGVSGACGDIDLSLVATRPLFNSSYAPLARTELARYKLEDHTEGMKGLYLAQADDLSRQIDGTHFTASAQIGYGMRMAAVWDRHPTVLHEQGIFDPVMAPAVPG